MKLITDSKLKISSLILNASIFFLPVFSFYTYKPAIRPSEILFLIFLVTYGFSLFKNDYKIVLYFIFFNFLYLLFTFFTISNDISLGTVVYIFGKYFLLSLCATFFYIFYKYVDVNKAMSIWKKSFYIVFFGHLFAFIFTSHDYNFHRSFLFYEGNFASLFYLTTFILFYEWSKLNAKKHSFLLLCILIAIFLTKSTMGIISIFILLIINLNKKILIYLIIFFGVFFTINNFLDFNFYEKFNTNNELTSFSLLDRIDLIKLGINAFLDHPVFGAGFSSYPFVVDPNLHFVSDRDFFIANNIYIDILVNYGVFGSSIFFSFIFLFLYHKNMSSFIFMLLPIFIHLNAYPTFYIPYIWVALALLKRIHVSRVVKTNTSL